MKLKSERRRLTFLDCIPQNPNGDGGLGILVLWYKAASFAKHGLDSNVIMARIDGLKSVLLRQAAHAKGLISPNRLNECGSETKAKELSGKVRIAF